MHVYKKPDVNRSIDGCLGLYAFFLCKAVNCNGICYWEKGQLSCCGNVRDLTQISEETPFIMRMKHKQSGGVLHLSNREGSTVAGVSPRTRWIK